jgi:hypothetical protein
MIVKAQYDRRTRSNLLERAGTDHSAGGFASQATGR